MNATRVQREWLYWFDRLDTDEVIRGAASMAAVPVHGLRLMPAEEARGKLDRAWQDIFVPGAQHVEILRTLVDQARGVARSVHPTIRDYNCQRSMGPTASVALQPIRCLAGLAGVSKSSLMKALERICQLEHSPQFETEGQRLLLYPVRRISIAGHPSVRSVLKTLANPIVVAAEPLKDLSALMTHLRDWFLSTGTCTLVVDEMQFFTQSSGASAMTAQLIMTLASLGIPVVYVANYSLVNKLMQRPHEEQDRLLTAPLVLNAAKATEPWWAAVVAEYLAVSPECFRLDPMAHVAELHLLTGGIPRGLRNLLLQSYLEAVALKRPTVGMEEVRRAYRSRAYSSYRKNIEDLASLSVSSHLETVRPDLVCPFGEVRLSTSASMALKFPLATQNENGAAHVTTVSAALVESTISAGARATLQVVRKAANRPKEERIDAQVTRLPRRVPVSTHSLLEGAKLLRGPVSKPPLPDTAESPPSALEPNDAKAG